MISILEIESPIGKLLAGATGKGLCLLEFTDGERASRELKELESLLGDASSAGNNKYTRQIKKELKEYFSGKRKEFTIPLVIPGSDFNVSVWNELLKIPYGTTLTYNEQAKKMGKQKAIRAIAHANGLNRIAIIIPCHRVIGSGGELTGYGGGLHRKKWLLEHEGRFSGKPVELSLF